ncbi:MAG: helix-turn-helix domain-containing protein [Actinobacteria bacterium]|nr:MAG: helix-turn-helix domain-containing protein [Actinomycetota bacterium]
MASRTHLRRCSDSSAGRTWGRCSSRWVRLLLPSRRSPLHREHSCDKNASVGNESGGVGARVRIARRSAGLTQRQLADQLGVESITVSRWERGVTSPSIPRLKRIAEVTDTTVSDLVRAPDAQTTHGAELAALREELAETRQLVDRIARAVERLGQTQPSSSPVSVAQEI